MRNYHFRLATILRIRALEERVARDRYMVSLRERRQAEEVLRAAKEALLSLEAPQGVVSIGDVRWSADQAERMSSAILASFEVWRHVSERCEEQRRAWSEASKRSSVLERLDESGRAAWREETLRQETLELDDVTNSRFISSGLRR
jgi:flagellar export protein FliJ